MAERALQDVKQWVSKCFVLLNPEETGAGLYTLAAMSVAIRDLPPEQTKKLPRYPLLLAAVIEWLAIAGQDLGALGRRAAGRFKIARARPGHRRATPLR